MQRLGRVAVIGLGYVGLPFAVEKAKVGFKVVGIDQDAGRVERVNRGENYIPDVHDGDLAKAVKDGRLSASTDVAEVSKADAIVICVPTPLTKNLVPDLRFVESVGHAIAPHLHKGQLVSLESTTYPGTTRQVLQPILEAGSGLRAEKDFLLAHSPERVDPGNKRYTTKNTNKVVGGVGPRSLKAAVEFYGRTIEHVVPVSSADAAELVKVFENTYRAVNIALVNELALLCDRMELDIWEVLEAAFTKPFGIQPFFPGPGVGGHCIPLDPHYLEWKAKEFNFNTHFINLAGEINRRMPEFVREKATRILNDASIPLRSARLLVVGAAYKRDLGDCRESPALEVIRLLQAGGATVEYHDPHVPDLHDEGLALASVPLQRAAKAADLVIIVTDHSTIDYSALVKGARRVFDTRNATRAVADRSKVTRL